ncbi:NAD(P)-dependent oxidoreductase [Natronobiforma cellulositropha]|uniref:NAD(P)-dependent oxidoreductase n=1 Tax=Natronobiforma cellulositropha TaxID=1679076 RepID=UPI0021D600CB|nr:NAD(P)-dependent oxidoreductase [Natronobiforma cellulositropha]
MDRIGFLGLGTMGSRMARNIVADGHDLTVFDLRQEAIDELVAEGAKPAADVSALADASDVVMMCLPGPDHVLAVVDELEPHLEEGTILVDLTTSTPETTNAVAEELTERSVDVLGAPISGGRAGAEDGTLAVMVGGERAAFETCEPLFESIAANVFHVGDEPGHGHGMKLVNNYLSFVAMICTSEATMIGQQVGLELETMLDVFNTSSGRNTATSFKFPEYVVTGRYDMEYEMSLVEKDMGLLMSVAEGTETPFTVGGTIRQVIAQIRGDIGPDGDYTEMYEHFKRTMGDAERRQ